MKSYKEIIADIDGLKLKDALNRKQLIVLEQEIFRKLVEEHKTCQKCGREDKLSLDHIVPKDVLRSFGVDIEREIIDGNYMLLCKICNSFKGNRLDFSLPATKSILTELLSRV